MVKQYQKEAVNILFVSESPRTEHFDQLTKKEIGKFSHIILYKKKIMQLPFTKIMILILTSSTNKFTFCEKDSTR